MSELFKLPLWILMWLVQAAFKLPMMLLGLVVMPFMYKDRHVPIGSLHPAKRLFANPEDWTGGHLGYYGSVPPWYYRKFPDKSEFYRFYRYHAIRNPADGLRNVKWLQLWIEQDKVKYWTPEYKDRYEPGSTPCVHGYFAWQGIYAGLKIQWVREKSYSELKLGFRIEPRNAHHPLPENSTRRFFGASFASKFIINRAL